MGVPNDLLIAHSDEFTAVEAGDEAGAVGFWFRAVQANKPLLAVKVWNAIIRHEHYISKLPEDPASRTPEMLATLALRKADADAAKQEVRDAEAAAGTINPFVEHDRGIGA